MKNFPWATAIIVAVLLVTVIVVLTSYPGSKVVVYNCSLAEISPDIPVKVREQCRKANAEAYRK